MRRFITIFLNLINTIFSPGKLFFLLCLSIFQYHDDHSIRLRSGLGVHGLTADHTNALTSLHTALKTELQRHIDTYKAAIHKLEELSPITVSLDPAQSSHQRLLAINYNDIQQRLIDNKTLLTMLDKPALKQLQCLTENLSQRVQNDKEVLFCVGQIKRIDQQIVTDGRPAAGLLMNFSSGCDAVLHLMGPLTAPCSPSGSHSGSDGYHSDSDTEDAYTELVRQYKSLYIKDRAETLHALDNLPQLRQGLPLKSKILFSIIVVSLGGAWGRAVSCSAGSQVKCGFMVHGLSMVAVFRSHCGCGSGGETLC